MTLDGLVNKGSSECFRKLSVYVSGEAKREKVAGEQERETFSIYQPLLFSFSSLRGHGINNLTQVRDSETFAVK